MAREQDLRREIAALSARPDHEIGLAEGALLIAKTAYPDLKPAVYLDLLDGMATRLRDRIEGIESPELRIAQMNRLFFEEEGFKGNERDYYDPRNSYLNEVLNRKLGIPITLSIAYIEVGRRAGLRLYGIGFPGHFLTGLLADTTRFFIDPFNNGKILSEQDCRRLLQSRSGGSHPFRLSFLDPAWPKEILVRLLRNLKAVYMHQSLDLKALGMVEWILILDPNAARERKERGFFYEAVGDAQGAIKDYERYLELETDAEDAESVRAAIARLKMIKSPIH